MSGIRDRNRLTACAGQRHVRPCAVGQALPDLWSNDHPVSSADVLDLIIHRQDLHAADLWGKHQSLLRTDASSLWHFRGDLANRALCWSSQFCCKKQHLQKIRAVPLGITCLWQEETKSWASVFFSFSFGSSFVVSLIVACKHSKVYGFRFS